VERPLIRSAFRRNFRNQTKLVTLGIQKYGIQAVALQLAVGPWVLAAAVFGVLGAWIPALDNGSSLQFVAVVCDVMFAVLFLIGVSRFVMSIRSKNDFSKVKN